MCSGTLAREGGEDLGTRIAGCRETPAVARTCRISGGPHHEGITMGKLARLIGLATDALGPASTRRSHAPRRGSDADRAAIARYDYLLQTADPQQVEQIHREAFARLTPEQRTLVEDRMREELSPAGHPRSSSPNDLARAAGRAEAMNPGLMRGLLARVRGAGTGGAAVAAGGAALGLLGVVAGGAVVSTVAEPLMEQAANIGVDFESLADGLDVDALTAGAGDLLGATGDAAFGLGDAATGWGERLGDIGIPGVSDLFGR